MIQVRALNVLAHKLAAIRTEAVMRQAADLAGTRMMQAVQAQLATESEGSATSTERAGSRLYDSIDMIEAPDGVVVGTSDQGAPFLELGTRHEMPKPFLAPAAMQHGADAAKAAGAAIMQAIAEAVT